MKSLEWPHCFSHYKSMGIFRDAQGHITPVPDLIWPNFELIQDFMVVLVTCKNEDRIKMKALECS